MLNGFLDKDLHQNGIENKKPLQAYQEGRSIGRKYYLLLPAQTNQGGETRGEKEQAGGHGNGSYLNAAMKNIR